MAELALAGMTGPADAFENSRGFPRLLNDGIWEDGAVEAIGRDWLMRTPGIDIKRIPVCLSAHAAVDALMDIVVEHGLDRSAISRVICDVGPVVHANLVYDRPVSPQEAQFSLPFCIGATLVHGDLSLVDCETGEVKEVTISRSLLEAYKKEHEKYCKELESFCTGRALPFFRTTTNVPFDELVLRIFRAGGFLK